LATLSRRQRLLKAVVDFTLRADVCAPSSARPPCRRQRLPDAAIESKPKGDRSTGDMITGTDILFTSAGERRNGSLRRFLVIRRVEHSKT
jgi:hypothetical protein